MGDRNIVPWMYDEELAWKLAHSNEEPGYDLFSRHIAASSTVNYEGSFAACTK